MEPGVLISRSSIGSEEVSVYIYKGLYQIEHEKEYLEKWQDAMHVETFMKEK